MVNNDNFFCSYQNHQRNVRERQALENQQAATIANPVPNDPNDGNVQTENIHSEANLTNAGDAVSDAANEDSMEGEMISSPVTPNEHEDNNRLPSIALLRTFVLSFFASLIPETPAV